MKPKLGNNLSVLIILFLIQSLISCKKETPGSNEGPPNNSVVVHTVKNSKAILVDASKDGGVWWWPQTQSNGYSENKDHQGKPLVDYLKNLGYEVDELPLGAIITTDLLRKYSKVIRPAAFFGYSADEISAYQSFLADSSSLLLMSDHMQYTTNDLLSVKLGVFFEGVYWADITSFKPHPITNGVGYLFFNAGSVIMDWDPSKITALGLVTVNLGTTQKIAAAMGIVNHKTSRIFFMGDTNCIETLPEPFTSNLVNWLFK